MELSKNYYTTTTFLQNVSQSISTIKEEQKSLNEKTKNLDWTSKEKNDIIERYQYLNSEYKKLELIHSILVNNLLHIQQQLLYKCMEYYQEHYKNKRIGEKTKEKIEKELEEIIKNTYNIEVYVYVKCIDNFNDYESTTFTQPVSISLYFKDYYYVYTLKQEEIHYKGGEVSLYYYSDVEYVENVNEYGDKMYNDMNTLHNEIEELEKALNNKIDLYNLKLKGGLNDKRLGHIWVKNA